MSGETSGEEVSGGEEWVASLGYEEVAVLNAGKRCGVQWDPWMGDWFNSWSPRNDNSNAEGPWDHWVDLALMILADPMTKIVRPAAFIADRRVWDFNDRADRRLTAAELMQRFHADPAPPVSSVLPVGQVNP